MLLFTRRKLIKELNEYKDIVEAEKYVRAYPISLKEKIQIIKENEKLVELRNAAPNYSPHHLISKVNKF